MKLNKEFAVRVNGKLFTANEIFKINIDGTKFSMSCCCGSSSVFDVSACTRDVEFVSVPRIPKLAQGGVVTGRDRTHTYHEYCKVGDEPASDIEIVSPTEKLKKAFNEAIKEMGNTPKTIQVGITLDGEQFAKAIKPGDAWHNRKNDNLDGAGFFDLAVKRIEEDNEVREAIKEVVREVMTEDAVERILAKKVKLEIDPDAFTKLMKKYNQDQARR